MNKNRILFKISKFQGYLMVLPALIYLMALIGYPLIYNWVLSFQNVEQMTVRAAHREFVGLGNFKALFADPSFRGAIRHTFTYTVGCLIFQFSIGFLLAMFMAKSFPASKTIRSLLVITWILPMTVTALLWKFMLSEFGVLNYILVSLGFIDKSIPWLTEGKSALWGLIITNSWVGIPFNMLLLTTGLNNIPTEVYEAASIDGVNVFQKFFYLTVPMLKATIMSVLTLGFVYTFKVFDLVYVVTGGGPVDATEVVSTYSYKMSFVLFNFGKGAAAANVLFLALLCIGFLYI